MTRASWSPEARADLRALLTYLKTHNRAVARVAADDLFMKADQLTVTPRMGRPGAKPGTRERSVPRWKLVIVYRLVDGRVEVTSLRDTRRDG